MPSLEPVYINFRTGLHIGRHGIGQEETLVFIPADTLFAALASVHSVTKSNTDEWVERFHHIPPFLLTSAFPFAGQVRFYPRPVQAPPGIAPKDWRKIRFVSENVLKHLLSGELPDSLLPPLDGSPSSNGLTLQDGSLWLSTAEIELLPESFRTKTIYSTGKKMQLSLNAIQRRNLWTESSVPRVLVDRITYRSEIYHTGRVTFSPGCGLWFGVQWRDPSFRQELLELLSLLADNGLGAERSVGYGAFNFSTGEAAQWPDPQPNSWIYLLSRFYPKDEHEAETLTSQSSYELVYVAGRTQTLGAANQRRKGAYLVAEGSLISGSVHGALAEVTPREGNFPHQVFRYGLAIGLEVRR